MLKLQQYCCALSCFLCTTRVHCSQKPSLATWLSQAGLLHGAIDQVNPFLIPYRFFERAKDVRDERAVAGRSSNSLGIVGRARRELVGQVVARLLHGAGQKRGQQRTIRIVEKREGWVGCSTTINNVPGQTAHQPHVKELLVFYWYRNKNVDVESHRVRCDTTPQSSGFHRMKFVLISTTEQ